jgi:uncharacterized membrane protein
MKETGIVMLAALVAAGMGLLVRAGVGPTLRAAIRTTVVFVLGWSLAYVAEPPASLAALSWRLWLMLALSVLAIGVAWWLHFLGPKPAEPGGAAPADKVNVFIAAAFALLLFLGPSGARLGVAALMLVAGAAILAWGRK